MVKAWSFRVISCRQYVKRRQGVHDLLGLNGDGGDAGDEVQEVAGLCRGAGAAARALGHPVIGVVDNPGGLVGAHTVALQQPVQATARPQQVVLRLGGNTGNRHMLVVDDRGLVILPLAVLENSVIAHLLHVQQAR